jgi:hypothetical protein
MTKRQTIVRSLLFSTTWTLQKDSFWSMESCVANRFHVTAVSSHLGASHVKHIRRVSRAKKFSQLLFRKTLIIHVKQYWFLAENVRVRKQESIALTWQVTRWRLVWYKCRHYKFQRYPLPSWCSSLNGLLMMNSVFLMNSLSTMWTEISQDISVVIMLLWQSSTHDKTEQKHLAGEEELTGSAATYLRHAVGLIAVDLRRLPYCTWSFERLQLSFFIDSRDNESWSLRLRSGIDFV